MSNLRWKVITIVVVFIVFFGVGVYPILANVYNLPAPQWLRDRQLKLGLDLKAARFDQRPAFLDGVTHDLCYIGRSEIIFPLTGVCSGEFKDLLDHP